jgi:hypothetical protein
MIWIQARSVYHLENCEFLFFGVHRYHSTKQTLSSADTHAAELQQSSGCCPAAATGVDAAGKRKHAAA